MITAELYSHGRPLVILERDAAAAAGAWARVQSAMARGVVGGAVDRIEVRVDVFLAELSALREARARFGEEIKLGRTLEEQLRSLAADRRSRDEALACAQTDLVELAAELRAVGFVRELKPFQLENLARVLQLPHGADFSVPGAGKTTVALASFALNSARGRIEQMLVVGPLAAFQAWKDDVAACFRKPPRVRVHGGPGAIISEGTEVLLTNYNRLAADYDQIRAFVARRQTQMILDEAHRVKRGAAGVHGRAVLDLAFAARRRDVLTGTPAPQGAYDLIALMRFLYPGQDHQILPAAAYNERDGRDEAVVAATSRAIARYFVRTPKSRLQLPATRFDVVRKAMGPVQQAIYEALIGRYRGAFALSTPDRRQFNRLGRVVMYLLEAATNPKLLTAGSDPADDRGFAHPPIELRGDEPLARLLVEYGEYEEPWKYRKVMELAAEAATVGEKVLIWSNFVRNMKALARLLADYQPALVHGGVPPEDGAPAGTTTREAELRRFKEDPKCSVLIANPAAMGEGVSLHHWCHHAIYVDRTFNAGHFLQSQDRIHRLGLAAGTLTRFTLLISQGTIDESVDWRLRDKVSALAQLMDDPGLVLVSLPEADEDDSSEPVFGDDFSALAAHLDGGGAA
jgi:SNF2 family DNA or RNA helicase